MIGPYFLTLIRAMPLASTPNDILKDLQEGFEDVPYEAEGDLQEFIEDLVQRGLVGYEVQKA
jgi:hypothetical protein